MEHIDTISKAVDETENEKVIKKEQSGSSLLRSYAPSNPAKGGIIAETLGEIGEITLTVTNEKHVRRTNQTLDSTNLQSTNGDGLWKSLNQKRKDSTLRKIQSEPIITQGGMRKGWHFDNPAFNDTDILGKRFKRTSFADVVTEIIQEPIKEDIHPYGRGSLYRNAFGGEKTQIHSDDGKLIMWALVTIIVLSVAVGVIMMSQMYRANQLIENDATTTNMTNEIG